MLDHHRQSLNSKNDKENVLLRRFLRTATITAGHETLFLSTDFQVDPDEGSETVCFASFCFVFFFFNLRPLWFRVNQPLVPSFSVVPVCVCVCFLIFSFDVAEIMDREVKHCVSFVSHSRLFRTSSATVRCPLGTSPRTNKRNSGANDSSSTRNEPEPMKRRKLGKRNRPNHLEQQQKSVPFVFVGIHRNGGRVEQTSLISFVDFSETR